MQIIATALLVLIVRSESWGNTDESIRYGIRVASCRNLSSATTLVDSFNAQGLRSFCRKVDIPGKGQWCRVFIGTYTQREQASEIGRQLEDRGVIRGFIIQEVADSPVDQKNRQPNSSPLVNEDETDEIPSSVRHSDASVHEYRKKIDYGMPLAVPAEGKGAVPEKAQSGYDASPLYEIAMALFHSGRYQESLTQLETIRNQGISSGASLEFLLRRIADCHYFLGEKGSRPDSLEAINCYRNILRDYPRSDKENEATLYRLAKSYEYSELYYEALGECKFFSLRYPQSVYISEIIFMTAEMQYFTEQYAKALKKLKEYLRRFPGAEHDGVATFYLAECYLRLGQYDDAGDWYNRTMKKWPSLEKVPPKILMRLGEYFFHVGAYEKAAEMFSLCVNLYPEERDCKKALLMFAQTLMKADRPTPALKVYSTLLERYPESEEAQKGTIMLADAGVEKPEIKVPSHILSGMGYYYEPVHTYDEMIEKTRDLATREAFISLKVHALAEEERYHEAFACCDRLLSASPQGRCRAEAEKELIRSSAHLVDDYYSNQDYLAVSELYFKTCNNGLFEDGGFDLLFKMGISLEKIGLADYAYSVFEKMLLRFSGRTEIDKLFLAVANMDYQKGMYERASDRLAALYAGGVPVEEEVIAGARRLAGDIYCRKNLFRKAVSLYATIPDKQRNTSELARIYKRYGDSLKEKGQYASAVKMYQDALAQYPGGIGSSGSIDEESYLDLADCLYREGKFERANALYEKVLNGSTESKDMWSVLNMGRGCLSMGDRITAEKHFSVLKKKSADTFWKDVADYCLNNDAWSKQYGQYIPR